MVMESVEIRQKPGRWVNFIKRDENEDSGLNVDDKVFDPFLSNSPHL